MVQERKTVLLVDDEPLFCRSLADGLRADGLRLGYALKIASNGQEAMAVLQAEPVHLLLTDLRMPVVDGFQLLAWMLSSRREIPTLVMTAIPSIDARMRLRESGVYRVLRKPVDLGEVQRAIEEELTAKRARVEGISIVAFLQLISMERVTCELILRSGKQSGRMHILDGELVFAELGELSGEEAAHALVGLPDVRVDMVERRDVVSLGLNLPLSAVILEALRLQDEQARGPVQRSSAPPPPRPPSIFPPSPALRSPPPPAPPPPESEPSLIEQPKGKKMIINVEKANTAVNKLRESLGTGLLATDVWSVEDGMSIAGYNSQPVATALFNRITDLISETLAESGFPALNKYYLLDLDGDKLVVVIPLGRYRAGILVDKKKAQLGVVVSVALPKYIASLEEASRG
ncbi:MAG: response regulator [Polyangiaceae bacterium]|jgi:CheY-like chemotaxis protein|nr:response regulator [Polyangiaceae bacterium]